MIHNCMEFLIETSLRELYDSAVAAYPRTGLRQHATQPIVITNLRWLPYLGVRTLFVKGLAQSEGHEYNPMIQFKGVNYKTAGNNSITETVKLYADDGMLYELERLSLDGTQVNLRCNCPDFRWRFSYYNSLDGSLYGRKPAPYKAEGRRPPANPKEMPGVCKHLIKLQEVLQQTNLFKEVDVLP